MSFRKRIVLIVAVVAVMSFVSFAFGEAAVNSPVRSKCIGIISAMQNEVNLLLSQAEIERIERVGNVDYHVGTLCGQRVVIAKAGVGKVLAASGMTAMLNRYPVTEVIFTGVAGGVGDETQVLDEVVASRLIQHDYGQITADGFEWFAGTNGEADYCDCDPELIRLAYDAASAELGETHVFKGVIASGDQFIASAEYVRRLQEDFGAVACEMEGAAVAAVCQNYGIPFVVIRCMSDKADGEAHETYENMADIAADQSSRIVLRMLNAINDGQ
ncbi:MAG: 5'-methylthioadenosine/adenosylhomocysteine nucleosidase [Clostridia bacterium]|nr:5'-methylthioadenosine/adenosylhomocysteine nucleosidase [Clostridia bacterium]